MGNKTYIDKDVLTAARERIEFVFDCAERVCVSFSGGKDSTVLLHLAIAEAERRGRILDVLFLDWEAQYSATIKHIEEMLVGNKSVNPYWVALPISTCNESSFHDPMWTAWHPEKRDLWVRPMPDFEFVVSDYDYFSDYQFGMLFEEFIPMFNNWYAAKTPDQTSAFLVGIRADESLHRFRTIKKQQAGRKNYAKGEKKIKWSTQVAENAYNFYPIYDWRVDDVWTFIGREQLAYNKIYDKMYLAGMSFHEMRICEPYSMEARRHLDKYQYLEPDTWARVVERTGGVNFGAKHGKSQMFAYQKIKRPEGMTWKEYAQLLLGSMPPPLRDHYRRRIDVFFGWFEKNLGWTDLKEESDPKLEAKKLGGSWRMVCRTLLRNDYFCTHLSFSVNKREFDKIQDLKEKYKNL